MLAQNFKTPTELGITDIEFDALQKVLGMLERGEILPAPETAVFDRRHGPETPTMFRMTSVWGYAECGTACCLMGWAQHVANDRDLFMSWEGRSVEPLFFPLDGYCAIISRNPEHGAIALRNYLTHGEPRWSEATSLVGNKE